MCRDGEVGCEHGGSAHGGRGHHVHVHPPADGSPLDPGARSRVVVAGKGGVGKSTLTALLARLLARSGYPVVAVDGDEQCNLGPALGLDAGALGAVVPLAEAGDYVEEKTGARPGEGAGGMLRLNPDVADVVDRLGTPAPDGVRLLVMGGVGRAGGGCLCPETSLLAATLAGMRLRRHEVVLLDTHAGVEHFGRSLARGFDQAVVVVDPTFNAVQVGLDTARLAAQLGIGSLHLVVNRVRGPADMERALGHLDRLGGWPFDTVHALPHDERALEAEPSVDGLLSDSDLAHAAALLAGELLVAPVGRTAAEAAR